MNPTDRYAITAEDPDHENLGKFQTTLREVVCILRDAAPEKVRLNNAEGPVAYHSTTLRMRAIWRRMMRDLRISASVSPGEDRPIVRLVIDEAEPLGKANHKTTILCPLRLDYTNYLEPGCTPQSLIGFLDQLYQSTRRTLSPWEINPYADTGKFDEMFMPIQAELSHLIHAFEAPPFVNPKSYYVFTFAKPYALPSLSHLSPDGDQKELTPVLAPKLASVLAEGLPELVRVVAKLTDKETGFAIAPYQHGPFAILPPTNVVEQMKALKRFAHLAPDPLFQPGVYTPALAA